MLHEDGITSQSPLNSAQLLFNENPNFQAFLRLAERVNVIVGVADYLGGNAVFLNENARDIFGFDKNLSAESIAIEDFHTKESFKVLKQGIVEAKKNGSWTGLIFFTHFKTGEIIPTELQAFFLDENEAYIAMWARDLRENFAIKKEKEKWETSFQNFISNSPAMTYMKSTDGRYINISKNFEEITDLTEDDIINHTDEELFNDIYASNRHGVDMEVIKTGKNREVEDTFVNSWGKTLYFRSYKFPMLNDEFKIFAVGSISIDITEKKQVEAQLEDERRKALASSKLASLGEMAAGIAHEINNPLSIIAGKVGQIERRMSRGESNEVILADLKKITATTDRISKIVRGFKSFAHSSDSEPVRLINFNELLEEVYEICHMRFKYKKINCIPQVEDNITFEAKESQIFQVIINLLNNSFDAIKESGGWIKLIAQSDPNHVFIDVIDSGHGIEKSIQNKIFLPFFTSKGPSRGTGLGLSISKSIVESHGGKLTLDKNYEHTKFSITLPKRKVSRQ